MFGCTICQNPPGRFRRFNRESCFSQWKEIFPLTTNLSPTAAALWLGVNLFYLPQNIRPTLSPMNNTLILCSYQFLLSKRNQAAVLQRSNLNSHTEIGAMKVYTNTVISTHNIFYCTGLKNECPYLWKVCLSTLCANEISWPTYIHYIIQ